MVLYLRAELKLKNNQVCMTIMARICVHERISSSFRVQVVLSSYVCFRGWDPYTETIHFVGPEGGAHECGVGILQLVNLRNVMAQFL